MRSPAWTQIKKGWNRLCSITLREKTVFVILLAGLVLLLVPMLVLARYDVPSVDDFTYAIRTVHAWRQTNSLSAVLVAAVQQMLNSTKNETQEAIDAAMEEEGKEAGK